MVMVMMADGDEQNFKKYVEVVRRSTTRALSLGLTFEHVASKEGLAVRDFSLLAVFSVVFSSTFFFFFLGPIMCACIHFLWCVVEFSHRVIPTLEREGYYTSRLS